MSNSYSILLTFDVEDWFQVENFKEYIPFSSWPSRDLRVEKNINRILDLLDSQQSAVRNQRSEVRSQRSVVRSQRSAISGQKSISTNPINLYRGCSVGPADRTGVKFTQVRAKRI